MRVKKLGMEWMGHSDASLLQKAAPLGWGPVGPGFKFVYVVYDP